MTLRLLTLVCLIALASASTEILQGNIYDLTNLADPSPNPKHNLTAGNVYASDFLVNQPSTNATLGEALGFCVALRTGGPSQCQYTLQLASGTVQARD